MEILIAGTIDVDPERRDDALHAGAVHLAPTREQAGCLAYVWSADPQDPGRIHVFERWADAASLEAHFGGPHYRGMRDTMAGFGIRGVDVAKYAAGRRGAIYDPSGRPRADFFEGP